MATQMFTHKLNVTLNKGGSVMTQSVEQLIQDRDEALKHYEYCLEHYGETDEDTIQSENDYNTLESLVEETA